eukprot:70417-Amphidinium_carterae.1
MQAATAQYCQRVSGAERVSLPGRRHVILALDIRRSPIVGMPCNLVAAHEGEGTLHDSIGSPRRSVTKSTLALQVAPLKLRL